MSYCCFRSAAFAAACLAAAALWSPASAAETAEAAAARRAIAVQNARFSAALRDADRVALAALYTEDAQLLPPNRAPVVGREAVLSFWTGGDRKMQVETTLTSLQVEAHGDTAIEVGRAVLEAIGADGTRSRLDQSKYIVIWKREGGSWKVHRDIFNSDLPPRAP
jgi:ketosteroid isomerase-like protein